MIDDVGPTRTVEVRTRRTFRYGTEGSFDLAVPCPESLSDVPLRRCVRCPKSAGLRLDPDTKQLVVRCKLSRLGPFSMDEVAADPHRTAGETCVGEIMTANVISVGLDLPLSTLETLLLDRGLSGAPVVDEDGRVIGVVSKTDLVRYLASGTGGPEDAETKTVGDIMTSVAFCVPVHASVARAAALMALEGCHRLPVVDTARQVVGIVSSLDVLRWLARNEGYVLGEPHRRHVNLG
jgi:CBS domain-containing protein